MQHFFVVTRDATVKCVTAGRTWREYGNPWLPSGYRCVDIKLVDVELVVGNVGVVELGNDRLTDTCAQFCLVGAALTPKTVEMHWR